MTYSGHAASSTVSAEAHRNAAISLLGVVIPASARRNPHETFFRPAVGVGDVVAAVAVKHPSLLSLGLVSPPGITIGAKQSRAREVLAPFVGWMEGWEKFRNEGGAQAPQHGSSSAPPGKARSSSHGVLARRLFYTGWHANIATAFCGCFRRVSHAF
jgi:hypothetical protein